MGNKRIKKLGAVAVLVLIAASVAHASQNTFKMTTDIPRQITTPDKVETSIGKLKFFDGVPDEASVDKVYDYVDRARAVEVFINMTPAVSMYHLRQGMRDIGLRESNQVLMAEQLGDAKPLVLTWNNTSLYTWSFLDLNKDGPTVGRGAVQGAGRVQ